MKTSRSPLEYPVTIKLVEGFLVFSVKDFGLTLVEEMPADGRPTPEFMRKVTANIVKCWLKVKDLGKTKPLTVPQVAKLLKISENSVRRIPKEQLRYRRTKGGHRRYSVGALKAYREQYEPKVDSV